MGERRCAESPGIVYDSHLINPAINKSRQAFSFGKESRAMEYKVKSTKRVPAPGQYKDISLNAIKSCAPRGKFSQAPRNVDFTAVNMKEKLYVGFRLE
jgi:hypothetical protein